MFNVTKVTECSVVEIVTQAVSFIFSINALFSFFSKGKQCPPSQRSRQKKMAQEKIEKMKKKKADWLLRCKKKSEEVERAKEERKRKRELRNLQRSV